MVSLADIEEQMSYYRAIAPEYFDHAIDAFGKDEFLAAVDSFRPTGDVLELACGPGTWTVHLASSAASLTAVDAAPEMLKHARARVDAAGIPDDKVQFVEADLFDWSPERQYDAVFFGFWLSHVPPDRFGAFWSMIESCLAPGGQVFFVDDSERTEAELIEGTDSAMVQRRLNDGTAYRVVKVPHDPATLQDQLQKLGWNIEVTGGPGPFYWGTGTR